MELKLRLAEDKDAVALTQVQRSAIRLSLSADYSDDVLKCFSNLVTVKKFLQPRDPCMRLVAELDGTITGFGTLFFHGEIGGLYVAASHHKQGIGGSLLHALEDEARRRGLVHLRLESTISAEPFYLNRGYRAGARISHRLSEGPAIDMTVVPMVKTL